MLVGDIYKIIIMNLCVIIIIQHLIMLNCVIKFILIHDIDVYKLCG